VIPPTKELDDLPNFAQLAEPLGARNLAKLEEIWFICDDDLAIECVMKKVYEELVDVNARGILRIVKK